MSEEILITVIGAGVVGCAVAYELSKAVKGDIAVIEKNLSIKGENQSSRNSGVIHAGIYYPKDMAPLKAGLCVEGNSLLYEFCKENKVPFIRCGKLVVATNELEEEYLEDVLKIANENGVIDLKVYDRSKLKNLEPNINAKTALFVPSSGIIEATSLVDAFYKRAEELNAIFLTGNLVDNIVPCGKNGFRINIVSASQKESFRTRVIINSAGLYSDYIARMINPGSSYEIEPVKGESVKFFSFKRPELNLSGMNIYPVPFGYLPDGERLVVYFNEFLELFKKHKVTKSVGIHISPTFEISKGNGSILNHDNIPKNTAIIGQRHEYRAGKTYIMGPAYSKPDSREDYKPSRDENYFLQKVLPFFPGIKLEDISLNQVGIRAKLKNFYDFIIERDSVYPDFINLIGIDSPGLTSSPAIAKFVLKMVIENLS